jgi:hypothetical protein
MSASISGSHSLLCAAPASSWRIPQSRVLSIAKSRKLSATSSIPNGTCPMSTHRSLDLVLGMDTVLSAFNTHLQSTKLKIPVHARRSFAIDLAFIANSIRYVGPPAWTHRVSTFQPGYKRYYWLTYPVDYQHRLPVRHLCRSGCNLIFLFTPANPSTCK